MAIKREIQTQVRRIAQVSYHDQRGESSVSEGSDTITETVAAPAVNSYASLTRSPLVEDSLELTGPDGTLYTPDVDYYEDPSEGRFENLSIPEGTALTATYHYEEIYASQGPHLVLSEGASMPQRESMDFRGFTVTDDETADATVITASGGSGGSGGSGESGGEIDGGRADEVYLASQIADGGNA